MTEHSSPFHSHPAYDRLFRIYVNAVKDWHGSPGVQEAARTLGMSARAYCDSRLQANQLQWASNRTDEQVTREMLDYAYDKAVDWVCGVTA